MTCLSALETSQAKSAKLECVDAITHEAAFFSDRFACLSQGKKVVADHYLVDDPSMLRITCKDDRVWCGKSEFIDTIPKLRWKLFQRRVVHFIDGMTVQVLLLTKNCEICLLPLRERGALCWSVAFTDVVRLSLT